MNKTIRRIVIYALALICCCSLFVGCSDLSGNNQTNGGLQYDTNGNNQKNPIDSWMDFTEGRGKYETKGTTVKLVENETKKDKDNWPNYDFHASGKEFADFSFETVIKVDKAEMDELNALSEDMILHPKFGLRVWKDEANFFSVFLIPGNKKLPVSMLSMYNGGWAQLWTAPNAPDYVTPESFDFVEEGVKLKIERNNQILRIFLNDKHIHTEEGFRVKYNENLKIGFTSERINNVSYTELKINQQEFKKIDLRLPEIKMDGNILVVGIVPDAERYQLKVNEQVFDLSETSINLYNFLKENNIAGGELELSVRALANAERFNEGQYCQPIKFNFNPDGVQLFAPEFKIEEGKLIFTADSNATDYVLKVSLADVVLHEITGITGNYDLTEILANMQVNEEYKFELMAKGDGKTVTDSEWKELLYKGKDTWVYRKGFYTANESSVVLVKPETDDGDNYGAGYDVIYMNKQSADFEISADIFVTEKSHMSAGAKYGIKIGINETSYFSAFVCPNINKISLLSTLDGGTSWVQIWGGNYDTNIDDYKVRHNLKIVRTRGEISVYFNEVLLHTEKNYNVSADELLNIGFTSEGVSDLHYENIILTDRSSVWTPLKGEYKEGKNSLTLTTQATNDGDNYMAGYDVAYHTTKLANFVYSADVSLTENSHKSPSAKYGLKVGVSEASYFSVFVCLNSNDVVMLSSVNGGESWVQIWGGHFAINTTDYTQAINLKLVRNNGVIEVYIDNTLVHTENGYSVDARTPLNLGVTSEGVNDLHYTNILIEDTSKWEQVKGEYVEGEGSITLVTQATNDGDNYMAGYDRAYLKGECVNFEYSADVNITADSHMSDVGKYGLKIALSETAYFSVFVTPKTNEIVMLSSLDGGANWIQLWSGAFPTNTTDYTKAINLKLVRNAGVIEFYYNGVLLHTENNFNIGAEKSVKLGVTSEGVNDLHYTNITVKEL